MTTGAILEVLILAIIPDGIGATITVRSDVCLNLGLFGLQVARTVDNRFSKLDNDDGVNQPVTVAGWTKPNQTKDLNQSPLLCTVNKNQRIRKKEPRCSYLHCFLCF